MAVPPLNLMVNNVVLYCTSILGEPPYNISYYQVSASHKSGQVSASRQFKYQTLTILIQIIN